MAEAEKFLLYYDLNVDLGEEEEEDRGCDYDFADECVEPSLRDMGNCFECWLFMEVDAADRRSAKQLEEEAVETEVET